MANAIIEGRQGEDALNAEVAEEAVEVQAEETVEE
jgi:hypothetical protein